MRVRGGLVSGFRVSCFLRLLSVLICLFDLEFTGWKVERAQLLFSVLFRHCIKNKKQNKSVRAAADYTVYHNGVQRNEKKKCSCGIRNVME